MYKNSILKFNSKETTEALIWGGLCYFCLFVVSCLLACFYEFFSFTYFTFTFNNSTCFHSDHRER